MEQLRLIIIAGDPLVQAGLAARFVAEEAVLVTAQLSPLAVSLLEEAPPADLILWDVGWGDVAAWPDLTALDLPVLALLAEPEDVAPALAAGAAGAINREAEVDLLLAAIQALLAGLLVLTPTLGASLWREQEASGKRNLAENLTEREQQVLALVAEGLTNRAIAHQLAISEHTVKFHVNAIMTKLDAQSRTEAVVQATRYGLIAL